MRRWWKLSTQGKARWAIETSELNLWEKFEELSRFSEFDSAWISREVKDEWLYDNCTCSGEAFAPMDGWFEPLKLMRLNSALFVDFWWNFNENSQSQGTQLAPRVRFQSFCWCGIVSAEKLSCWWNPGQSRAFQFRTNLLITLSRSEVSGDVLLLTQNFCFPLATFFRAYQQCALPDDSNVTR